MRKQKQQMSNKKILIAEDNFDNYLLLKIILERLQYNHTHVVNGEQALYEILNNNYDLLLIDIQMPKINGYELLKIIRAKNIKTPAIAQTAFAFDTDKNKCFTAGFNDFISKPINRELLLQKINKLIVNE